MGKTAQDERERTSRRELWRSLTRSGSSAAAAPRPEEIALRRPGKSALVDRGDAPEGGPVTPSGAVIALNRMGYGPRPGDIAAFNALGGNDTARMAAYVAQQLDPDSINDSEVEARIAAANFESVDIGNGLDHYLTLLWAWYINDQAPSGNTSSSWPRDELIRATFLRAMYSKRQLLEVMVEFWHDHFNVYSSASSWIRATIPHLDRILRNNAFGNFRSMLERVAKAPAMLRYLDNYTSSNAGPNENYSRELFELHTLGAENYLGTIPQSQVPLDGDGIPIGYVDADVFESTRCFTGWSFAYGTGGDPDNGLFYYRSDWHDRFQKFVLGNFIPQDQPDLADGKDVLDALASHPGTGRHIARKLCRKFIGDDPPQSVIDAAAGKFTQRWQSGTQIEQVLEVILLSPEFLATWGEKTKRPYELAVSAMRAGGADFTLKMDDGDTSDFLWRYRSTGQERFAWPAPNGYPDVRGAWASMSPRVQGWRLANWLIDFDDDNDQFFLNVLSQTPGGVRTANELADFWINRILGRPMESGDRAEIVDFMAQGVNPDFDLDLNDDDTRDRVRSMVGLIFMSPDFLWR